MRIMLPLIPAYAVTIRKAQGMSLDKVIVNLGKTEFCSNLTSQNEKLGWGFLVYKGLSGLTCLYFSHYNQQLLVGWVMPQGVS